MQKFVLLFLTFLGVLPSLRAQWISAGHGNTADHSSLGVMKIMAPSEDVVWATSFDFQNLTPTQTFFRSTNGLETIISGTINTEDPSLTALDIFAFDEQTAWAAMTSEPCQCYGQLYRTQDGGQSWTRMLDENSPQSFIGIYFWSMDEGLAIGGNGTGQNTDQLLFLYTNDGGLSWTDQTPADLPPGENLRFGSSNGHYAVRDDQVWIGSSAGRIWHSADRGQNWEASSISPGRMITAVAFKNDQEGLAGSALSSTGVLRTNQLWRTEDGGQSWIPLAVPRTPSLFSLQYISGTPDTYVFSGGYLDRGMEVSTTGGRYWTPIPASYILSSTFLSPTIAYAGGRIEADNRGGLYRMASSFEPSHVNVKTLAGNGEEGNELGVATQSGLYNPNGMVYDSLGALYIANDYNNNVLRLTPSGWLERIAGGNTLFPGDRDSTALASEFNGVLDLDFRPDGKLVIADGRNSKVKLLDLAAAEPTVTTLAGSGSLGSQDGPAATASFRRIQSLAVGPDGSIYLGTDTNVRVISPDSMVTTLAGQDVAGNSDGQGVAAAFNLLWDMEVDADGNVFVADIFNHKIRRISPQGQVSTIAGTGNIGNQNGPARQASFSYPEGIALAPDGRIFVGDGANGHVRLIDTSGLVSVLAGQAHAAYVNGTIGLPGPEIINGDGEWATLSRSRSLLYTPQNSLLHSEWGSDMVRELQFGVPSSPLRFALNTDHELHTYPLSQLEPFEFSAEVLNLSNYPVKDVYVRVRAYEGTRLRYQTTTEPIELEELDATRLELEQPFTPNKAGDYRIEYDLFAEDAYLEKKLEYIHVSDSIMAFDDQHYYLFGSYGDFREDFEFGYGHSYTLLNPDTLTGLRFFGFIPGNTPVVMEVFRLDNGVLSTLVASHELANVTTNESGLIGEISLPFPALPLEAGTYLFTIQAQGVTMGFDNSATRNNYFLVRDGWTNTVDWFGAEDIQVMIGLILGQTDLTVSVEEFPIRMLGAEVFPNPFTDKVNLKLDELADVHLYLYDIQGRLLKRDFFSGDNFQIDNLNDLAAGIYTLLLEGKGTRQAVRLLKE